MILCFGRVTKNTRDKIYLDCEIRAGEAVKLFGQRNLNNGLRKTGGIIRLFQSAAQWMPTAAR